MFEWKPLTSTSGQQSVLCVCAKGHFGMQAEGARDRTADQLMPDVYSRLVIRLHVLCWSNPVLLHGTSVMLNLSPFFLLNETVVFALPFLSLRKEKRDCGMFLDTLVSITTGWWQCDLYPCGNKHFLFTPRTSSLFTLKPHAGLQYQSIRHISTSIRYPGLVITETTHFSVISEGDAEGDVDSIRLAEVEGF